MVGNLLSFNFAASKRQVTATA